MPDCRRIGAVAHLLPQLFALEHRTTKVALPLPRARERQRLRSRPLLCSMLPGYLLVAIAATYGCGAPADFDDSARFSQSEAPADADVAVLTGQGSLEQGAETESPLEAGEFSSIDQTLRRGDFGMDRFLSVRADTGSYVPVPIHAGLLQTTDSTTRGRLTEHTIASFDRVNWVGDANSYIDVFDNPLETSFPFFFGFTFDGSSSGTFERRFYPHASNAESVFSWMGNVFRFPRAVTFVLPSDRTWRAIRHYDRGECSASRTWAQVLAPIVAGLTTRLDSQLRSRSLGGATLSGSARGTATLKTGSWGVPRVFDQFTAAADYDVGACDGLMNVRFTGRFGASGDQPTYTLDSVSAPIDFRDDACAGFLALFAGHGFNAAGLQDEIRTTVENRLTTQLPGSIQDGITAAMARAPLPTPIGCTMGGSGDSLCRSLITSGLMAQGYASAAAALQARNASCMPSRADATAGECMFVPNLRRLNQRPDGIEVVLADRQTDPFYQLLDDADSSLCARPEGSTTPPMRATYGTVTSP